MPVKIYVAPEDVQRVARELLDAAEAAGLDPSHVRSEKTRGRGFIVSDKLAKHLGVADSAEEVSASDVKKLDVEPAVEASEVTEDKPKRGRPAGKKNQEPSDG